MTSDLLHGVVLSLYNKPRRFFVKNKTLFMNNLYKNRRAYFSPCYRLLPLDVNRDLDDHQVIR